uniref:Methyl-CpG-binding domain protein 2 n=1 Tax=Schistocephalus solidus TaxID=70667 RepID=A0A0X3P2A7_SCHSO
MATQQRQHPNIVVGGQKKFNQAAVYKTHGVLSQLPPGWKREEVFRCNGLNSGKSIVFYVTPTGQQARTPKELQLLLGDKFDVADFDWRSGKFSSQSLKSKTNDSTPKNRSDDKTDWFSRRVSPPLPKPLIVSSHNDSKRIEKPSTADCPKQVSFRSV